MIGGKKQMPYHTEDLRIQWTKVLLPPVFLEEELPITDKAAHTVYQARSQVRDILNGQDHRLIVVVGPCSIHDTKAAREYAGLLKHARHELSKELHILMRVYFEKPRTTIGWKGLINDPHLDQSFKINDGLRMARHLLLDLAEIGVPAGTEFLDMIVPQYVAGLVSWGAIGARTTESQLHRQLVSGLPVPSGSRTERPGTCELPSRRFSPQLIPTASSATQNTDSPRSLSRRAILTATSSSEVEERPQTTRPILSTRSARSCRKPSWLHVSWSIAAMPTATKTTQSNGRCVVMS